MRDEGDGPDYLGEAQLAVDPSSFVEVVREVYWLEKGCVANQEIAEVLGVHKSRITQIFGGVAALKASSIRMFLEPLASPEHRKAIVEAWTQESLGDLLESERAPLVGKVDEKTLRAIDREIRQQRLVMAANVTLDAMKEPNEPEVYEQLLDRAQLLYRRLDRPGDAMTIAVLVAKRAKHEGDVHRLAAAFALRIKTLIGLPDCLPQEVIPLFAQTLELLNSAGPIPDPKPKHYLPTVDAVQQLHAGARTTFTERGLLKRNESDLQSTLDETLARLGRRLSYQERSRNHQLAARLYLLLGKTFQAEEHLQKSFEAGNLKNLNILEASGIIQARIRLQTEGVDTASKYLREVIKQCRRSSSQYHRRIAEYELARVQSQKFSSLS